MWSRGDMNYSHVAHEEQHVSLLLWIPARLYN